MQPVLPVRIKAEFENITGGGGGGRVEEKLGFVEEAPGCLHRKRGSVVPDCNTESESWEPWCHSDPLFHFSLKKLRSPSFPQLTQSPQLKHKQLRDHRGLFHNKHLLQLLFGSQLHLFGKPFPKDPAISNWENGLILILTWVLFCFSIYPQLLPACWWNIPKNNAVGSASILPMWNIFGVLRYLSIKMFLKEAHSLRMSCLQACPWASDSAVSLLTVNLTCSGKALKCFLLQSLLYVHCIQIRMNPECKSTYLIQAVATHV